MRTDNSGAYGFSGVENVSFSGALVSVSIRDYFTDTRYILMSSDKRLDVDLERSSSITVGQTVHSQTGTARCASLGYGGMGGAPCRRLTMTATGSGRLDVTVRSDPARAFDVTILTPDGTIAAYTGGASPVRLAADVIEALTYQIDVFYVDPTTRVFELSTTIR